jgi:formate hydrogenlyase subunit 3/multisubunit Na+/H+ antiporter MnhD subunit
MFVILVSIFGVFTSSSWFMVWVWLEISVLGVLPLVVGAGYSVFDSFAASFYFLVQACGSFLVLLPGLLLVIGLCYTFVRDAIVSFGLAVKLGLFPVHFWVVSVARSLSW